MEQDVLKEIKEKLGLLAYEIGINVGQEELQLAKDTMETEDLKDYLRYASQEKFSSRLGSAGNLYKVVSSLPLTGKELDKLGDFFYDKLSMVYRDMFKEKTPDDIARLTRLWLPEQKGEVFFRVFAPVGMNESSKFAIRLTEPDRDVDGPVFSRGIVIDTENGFHKVLYEHSHLMGKDNAQVYRTIMGRQLSELSQKELQDVYTAVLDEIRHKGKLTPALIEEGYDEEIGEEDHAFYSVTFFKPFDEEQGDLAERHGVEVMRDYTDKEEYIFFGYDDAVNFSYDNIKAIERRGDHRREITDDDSIVFNVTFESSNRNLGDLAALHHGTVELSRTGTPLVMAHFAGLRDAKAYRDDVRHLESRAVKAVVDRTVSPRAKVFSADQRAYIGAYLMNGGAKELKDTSGELQKLMDLADKEPRFHHSSQAWKTDVFNELTDFLNGKLRDTQIINLHR